MSADVKGGHTPLVALERICDDLFDRWDQDMRSGKLLVALNGRMAPGYDPRVDQVRAALSSHPDLLEALKEACEIIRDLSRYANNNGGEIDDEEFREGLAAIAKAEGPSS